METFPKEIREGVQPLVYAVNIISENYYSTVQSSLSNGESSEKDLRNKSPSIDHRNVFNELVSSLSNFQSTPNLTPINDGNSQKQSQFSDSDTTQSKVGEKEVKTWARIIAVSKRHAFPPSKDPEGTQNRSSIISRSRANPYSIGATMMNAQKPPAATQVPPVDGIISTGWLEKHVHALPSVLLIVTYIDLNMDEEAANVEDLHLAKIIDQLRSSLATKRECRMHLVCCVLPPDSTNSSSNNISRNDSFDTDHPLSAKNSQNMSQNDLAGIDGGRFVSIRTKCRLTPTAITTLHLSSDGKSLASLSTPPLSNESPDIDLAQISQQSQQSFHHQIQQQYIQQQLHLKRLYRNIQDSANAYYLAQARRAKRKLNALHVNQYSQYLPLAARYCFKTAIFYEFQNYDVNSSKGVSGTLSGLSRKVSNVKSVQYWSDGYRYLEQYYKQLILVMQRGGDIHDLYMSNQMDDNYHIQAVDEPVEVALAPSIQSQDLDNHLTLTKNSFQNDSDSVNQERSELNNDDTSSSSLILFDMAHQCRTLASWLNFKIIQHGLVNDIDESKIDFDLISPDAQWRKHYLIFLQYCPNDKLQPKWYHLVYTANERLIMAQLSEDLGYVYEETLQFSCWKYLAFYVEDLLLLYKEIQKVKALPSLSLNYSRNINGSEINRYMGSLGSEGLSPLLEKEIKSNHLDSALKYALKTIAIFEKTALEIRTLSETQPMVFPNRSCARLYFIAGGLLLDMEQYSDAKKHLSKALEQCSGWSGLEYSIMRGIKKCEDNLAASDDDSSINTLMLLNPSIHQLMPPIKKQNVFNSIFHPRSHADKDQITSVSFPRQRYDTLPFTFVLTFPKSTHAIAGDIVLGCLSLQSNLPLSVSVNKIQIQTTVGLIDIDDEQTKVCFAPNEIKYFPAQIPLPFDLVSADESSTNAPGGRPQKTTTKIRTSGLTQGGGGYYLPIEPNVENDSTSLDNSMLGGVDVSCTGILLMVSGTDSANSVSLQLTLESNYPDESMKSLSTRLPIIPKENYIDIAWDRPSYHSLLHGPRCLRVLKPLPKLNVSNVTDLYTQGSAIEGVVNRIIIKVEAGSNEYCSDIQYSVNCTNTNISSVSGNNEKTSVSRPPIMVSWLDSMEANTSDNKNELPDKWQPHVSENSLGSKDVFVNLISSLEPGKPCFLCIDLFRSSPTYESLEEPDCKTSFEFIFSYKQVHDLTKEDSSDVGGKVTQAFNGSVTWCPPIRANFSIIQGRLRAFPCGSSHPSNQIEKDISDDTTNSRSNISMNDGNEITVSCVLEATEFNESFGSKVMGVKYQVRNIVYPEFI